MRSRHFISFAVFALFTSTIFAQKSESVGDTIQTPGSEKAKSVQSKPQPCPDNSQSGHGAVPIEGVDKAANAAQDEADKYLVAVRELLNQEKFDELDQMADQARRGKTRFGGGGWKLYTFYENLDFVPRKGTTPTDDEWETHLTKLRKWVSLKPDSITARVALAEGYSSYGWHARGGDYADKVTEEGWKLFDERLNLARVTLEQAAALKEKCPHWYFVAQGVYLSHSGDQAAADALLKRAVAFEPGYFYYYIGHANYLLPQWFGEEGDIAKFADKTASRIGDGEGDFVYFQIAIQFAHGTKDQPNMKELKKMSWTRIMRGFSAMEQRYGTSILRLNELARLAIVFGDASVAQQSFTRVGERWVSRVWSTKKQFFEDNRKWANERADYLHRVSAAAEADLQNPERRLYAEQITKEFQEKFAPAVRKCALDVDSNVSKLDVLLLVASDGTVNALETSPGDMVDTCLVPNAKMARLSPPSPSKGAAWVRISVDMRP